MATTQQAHPERVKPEWARDLPDTTDDGEPIIYGAVPMSPRVTAVEPIEDDVAAGRYMLRVTFETGEVKRFDCTGYLDKGVFRALKDRSAFRRVEPVHGGGGIGWASGADLSRDTLYAKGQNV